MIRKKSLPPVVKWAGGKSRELPYLLPLFPSQFHRYLDPFVGGGAVYLSVDAPEMLVNDRSRELIELFRQLRDEPEPFLCCLEGIWERWQRIGEEIESSGFSPLLAKEVYSGPSGWDKATETIMAYFEPILEDLCFFPESFPPGKSYPLKHLEKTIRESIFRKMRRVERLARERGPLPESDLLDNLESAFKGAYYAHLRHLYNHYEDFWEKPFLRLPLFYFLREFCYSSMFRYNKRGGFNVPYGGITYNRKDFGKKIASLGAPDLKAHLKKTEFFCLDFAEFFAEVSLEKDDFVFLDPPYDSDFSTYAGNSFGRDDQVRLAGILEKMEAKFLLVIKNSKLIRDLYLGNGFWVASFAKNYLVSFQNRNDKQTQHLLITNYEPSLEREEGIFPGETRV